MEKEDDHEVIIDRKYAYDFIGINQVLDTRNKKNEILSKNNPKKEKSTTINTKKIKKDKNVSE